MKAARHLAVAVLVLFALACVSVGKLAPADYAKQFREAPDAPPSKHFVLGTDELGRDRFSRLLYGARLSLLLAPGAALLSTLMAAGIGTVAGYFGGLWEKTILAAIDLFLSLPWFFLLITVRALLPLDVSPVLSVMVTFVLLGILGWAAPARVICAGVRNLRHADFMTTAQAAGSPRWRMIAIQLAPNLKPILWAQFLISIPTFILAEANLSMLGLGVSEPLPSLGSLLKDLESYGGTFSQPWRLAPLFLLMIVVWTFQILLAREEANA
jgi:peptide/nickel transport system permease protein